MHNPRLESGISPGRCLRITGALLALALVPGVFANDTDISLIFVNKTQHYQQTGPTAPVLKPNPFSFRLGANDNASRPNSIVSGMFALPPNGTFQNMTNDGAGNFFFDGGTFASLAALNAAFPDGTYRFILETVTPPTTYNASVPIAGDAYVNAVPQILNGTWSSRGFQFNPTQPFTITWNSFTPFSTSGGNGIAFQITDAAGTVVFTQFTTTQVTSAAIPANTLQSGQYYTATLGFQTRQVAFAGTFNSWVANYTVQTNFKMAPISGIPVLSGPTSPLGTVGVPFYYQIIATNHPYIYNAQSLPAGLTFDSTLGMVYGIPTTPGNSTVQLSATNISGVGTQTINPTIQAAPSSGPVIISSTAALYYAGRPFSFQVVTSGATAAARISATGLPPGLTLDPVNGLISGTTNAVGSFPVNLTLMEGICATPTPTGTPTPTPSPTGSPTATPTATPCPVLSENLDGVSAPALPTGWVATQGVNSTGALWVTSTATPDTAPNDLFSTDPSNLLDNRLDTPGIAITSTGAQVTFRNNYNTENTFDGGVLEVSSPNINGGVFTDITNAAVGGSFVTGGYNGTIAAGTGSPIAGRMAWTGNSGGYITTTAKLGQNVAGQTIKLRFRLGADNSVGATGWRVDTVTIADGGFTVSGFLQLTFTSDAAYPVITNADKVTVPRNQPFSYTIATPGAVDPTDPPVYTMLGTLPAGLGFDPATGTIAGTYIGPRDAPGSPKQPDLTGGALLGSVQLFGTNSHGTSTFQLLFLAPPSGVVNISTRLPVGTGEDVLIGGFIVTGNVPKVAIVRAIGPSLGSSGALQDPVLELHNGASVLVNDNWRTGNPNQEQIIIDTTIPPSDDRESALVVSLDPGSYTAIVSGANGTTGTGLVEIYDLGTASLDATSTAKLAQISTRGKVQAGNDVLIGGFIISGVPTKILARAIGPELNGTVSAALQDTTLELHDGTGATLATNDDWRSDQEQEIINTTVPPTDDRESAIVRTLTPGPYTAIVRGKNNTIGIALVEVYTLP